MGKERFSPEWVGTLAGLAEVARILEEASIIGVDLEADSMHHYFEKVCLLQLATESACFVVDPLAIRDLSALAPVFSNPRIRKVFHGADYDIRSLHRDFGMEVENLFDTQLAGLFLGLRETGLEALLRSRFQVSLKKKHQRADWSRRPLSPEMVAYAAMDGRYLIPLARMLEKELDEKGRLSWVEEECRLLSRVRFTPSNPGPLYHRVKGAHLLDQRSLAVLEALLQFREGLARKADLPPFKVLDGETLLELARRKPRCAGDLEEGKNWSRKLVDRYGAQLLREIERTLALPDEALPVFPRRVRPNLPFSAGQRVQALKAWRDRQAGEMGMEPGIILNNALINDLALKNPRSAQEMDEIDGLRKWQKTLLTGVIPIARHPLEGKKVSGKINN